MKQILQDARTGEIAVRGCRRRSCCRVRAGASSGLGGLGGTERASSEFASKNLLQKAKARPDLVRDVFTKLRRDGIASTWNAVRSRLDQPLTLGTASADRWLRRRRRYGVLVGERVLARVLVTRTMRSCLHSAVAAGQDRFADVSFTKRHLHARSGRAAWFRTAEAKLGIQLRSLAWVAGSIDSQVLRAAGCR